MTTFQDQPLHSRRAVRQSERDQAEPDAASSVDPASAATDGGPTDSAELPAEPLIYATQSRPPVPEYDGPGFRAQPTAESVDGEVESDPRSGGEGGFRPRDFSPEGRRATTPSWAPQYGGVSDDGALEYQTQGRVPSLPPEASTVHAAEEPDAVASAPAAPSSLAASLSGSPTTSPVVAPQPEAPPSSAPESAGAPDQPGAASPIADDTLGPIDHTLTRRELRALRDAHNLRNAGLAADGSAGGSLAPPAPFPGASSRLDSAVAEFDALAQAREESETAGAEDRAGAPRGRRAAAQSPEQAAADAIQNPDVVQATPEFDEQVAFAAQSAEPQQAEPQHDEPQHDEPQPSEPHAFDSEAAAPQVAESASQVAEVAPFDEDAAFAEVVPPPLVEPQPYLQQQQFAAEPNDAALVPVAAPADDSSPLSAFEALFTPPAPDVETPLVSEQSLFIEPAVEEPAVVESAVVEPVMPEPAAVEPPPAEPAPEQAILPEIVVPADDVPDLVDGSSNEAAVGHWSTQAELEDETQQGSATQAGGVGIGSAPLTTSALVLPTIPDQFGPNTGEILVTGSISLPESFSVTGAHPTQLDESDIDHLLDPGDQQVASTDSQPVRAIRAVSTHSSSRNVIGTNKPKGNRALTVLIVAATAMAAVVITLLVVGLVSGQL